MTSIAGSETRNRVLVNPISSGYVPRPLHTVTGVTQTKIAPFRVKPQVIDVSTSNQVIDITRSSDIIGIQFISNATWTGEFYLVGLAMFGDNRDPINVTLKYFDNAYTKRMTFRLELTPTQLKVSLHRAYYTHNHINPSNTALYALGKMVILLKEPI